MHCVDGRDKRPRFAVGGESKRFVEGNGWRVVSIHRQSDTSSPSCCKFVQQGPHEQPADASSTGEWYESYVDKVTDVGLVGNKQDAGVTIVDVHDAPEFGNRCSCFEVSIQCVHRVAKASQARAVEGVRVRIDHELCKMVFVAGKARFQSNGPEVRLGRGPSRQCSFHRVKHGQFAEPGLFQTCLAQGIDWIK